jgi:Flp pilus assembly protein TadD
MLRGMIRQHLSDLAGAREDVELSAKLEPDGPQTQTNLAAIRFLTGDFPGAVTAAERALLRDPRDVQARGTLGKAKLQLGDYRAALENLDIAIESVPDDAEALRARAMARLSVRDDAGARADLDRCLVLSPSYGAAYASRGSMKQGEQDYAGAIADYEAADRNGVAPPQAVMNRAFCLWKLGRFPELEAFSDEAMKRFPAVTEMVFWRGGARARLGEPDAAADLEAFIERDPGNPNVAVAKELLAKLR